jgi:hypothetical protein
LKLLVAVGQGHVELSPALRAAEKGFSGRALEIQSSVVGSLGAGPTRIGDLSVLLQPHSRYSVTGLVGTSTLLVDSREVTGANDYENTRRLSNERPERVEYRDLVSQPM